MKFRKLGLIVAGVVTIALTAGACSEAPTPAPPATGGSGSAAPCTKSAPTTAATPSATSSAAASSAAPSSAIPDATTSILDKASSSKKLVIGIKYDQPGLGLKQPDGTFAGFDVEVAKYVAAQLGVEEAGIEFKETPSAERENALSKGQVDMIFATYSITDKRKSVVSFAGPYFVAKQDLLVQKANSNICGPNDLNGKVLCSVKGSTSAQKVKDLFATGVQLQEYGGYSDCIQALKSGTVDAVTTDDVILAGYAAQAPNDFKVVGNGFSTENYGVGIPKGDTKAQTAINDAITKMQSEGAWKAALEKTVGPSGYTIPEPPAITEKA